MFSNRTNWNLKPNRLSEALAGHRAAGKPLLDLTVSNPTECGFDYDRQAICKLSPVQAPFSMTPTPKGSWRRAKLSPNIIRRVRSSFRSKT